MGTTMAKKVRVRLTGRRPVDIDTAQWPVIARATDEHACGQAGQNGSFYWSTVVRQHQDGRALVYVATEGQCQCDFRHVEGGELVPAGGDLPGAIERVTPLLLDSYAHCQAGPWEPSAEAQARWVRAMVQECVGSLPAEELS